ncbi:unannotated protein [freshwater metagenome]|uniref:Unannotated protein n=1 Tax=freshwater metagenome TaxID=449393 RepID=A0A6J7HL87_9ZZZZ
MGARRPGGCRRPRRRCAHLRWLRHPSRRPARGPARPGLRGHRGQQHGRRVPPADLRLQPGRVPPGHRPGRGGWALDGRGAGPRVGGRRPPSALCPAQVRLQPRPGRGRGGGCLGRRPGPVRVVRGQPRDLGRAGARRHDRRRRRCAHGRCRHRPRGGPAPEQLLGRRPGPEPGGRTALRGHRRRGAAGHRRAPVGLVPAGSGARRCAAGLPAVRDGRPRAPERPVRPRLRPAGGGGRSRRGRDARAGPGSP